MHLLRLLPFALLALSLSACVSEKDSSKGKNAVLEDKTSIQPIKELKKEEEPLPDDSVYVPEHGDEAINFTATELYKYDKSVNEDKLVHEDQYYNVKLFTHVPELPIQFGYQHTEVGPYLKTEHFKQHNQNTSERTSVQYSTLTPPHELLINHYLKSQIYSTVDFNKQTAITSQESDGLTTRYTNEEKLFDEVTGNEIGFNYSKSKVTALNPESITIRSGTYDAVRTSIQSEFKSTINDSISNTWTEVSEGLMWFDINTGTVLKTTSTITATNVDYPDVVYTTRYYSEFVSSDKYTKETININAAENNTDESLKSFAVQDIDKSNLIMTHDFFSTKLWGLQR